MLLIRIDFEHRSPSLEVGSFINCKIKVVNKVRIFKLDLFRFSSETWLVVILSAI